MDAQLKAKWVDALRSGKYQQTNGALWLGLPGEVKEFCCLGVLCDIQGTQWTGLDDHGEFDGIDVRDEGRSYLSKGALSRFGLTEGQQVELAELNDNGGTFAAIAKRIEQIL